MNTILKRNTLILGAALSAALTLSSCAGDSGTRPSDSAGASSTESSAASSGEAGPADVMFAQMMIPHHEQAVEMSDILLAKDGLRPEVATLAEEIRAAQAPEIEQMNSWLEDWGVDPQATDHGSMDHGGMDGMLAPAELETLEQADTAEATRLYLEGMIEHHEGAVQMAEDEVAAGQDPDAVALAKDIIETQNAEIREMRDLLDAGPEAAGPDGAPGSDSAVVGDPDLLADHGLAGLDARTIIERLDTQAVAERPTDLVASVQSEQLVVADDRGRQAAVAMPADEVYVSAAPYESQTHECHFHSLTTCLGELRNQDVRVTVLDQATGEVLIADRLQTFDNGFVGLWLPRGIEAELTVEHDGKSATSMVSTRNADDATCLTDLRLMGT
ncbi:CueP family metal-binding protein [Citricoccus sp.]|uniref:CueP family metal-binding protein n=1 Tax=Citricoccus sp. TaxID=1978372 RepID=UPI0028BF534F|nr:CueP family metal-binding protein [Citricoccus sp.]